MTILGDNNNANANGANKNVDLTAPLRPLGGEKKKTSPVLLLLLVLAGVGAGYFFVFSGAQDTPAPIMTAEESGSDTTAVADMGALLTDTTAMADPATASESYAPGTSPVVATESESVVPMAETVPSPVDPLVPATEAAATQPSEEMTGDIPVVEAQNEQPPADLPIAAETAPAEAEMAIVQNAAMLDQLSAPAETPSTAATAQAEPALPVMAGGEQEAMIRPLPKEYLIVKKNHDGGDIDSRLTAARLALSQSRNAAALQLFTELQRDYPRDSRIAMGRAVSLQKLGQNGEALSAYQTVLENDPKNLEALTNMLGLLKKENPALAVEKLIELRDAYPYNPDIAAQLGIAYASQSAYEEAEKYLDIAESLKPGSAYVLYNKAVLYDKMGRSGEAASLYRRIVRLAAEGSLDQQLPIEAIKRRLATIQ